MKKIKNERDYSKIEEKKCTPRNVTKKRKFYQK